jgi:hypothetical protein
VGVLSRIGQDSEKERVLSQLWPAWVNNRGRRVSEGRNHRRVLVDPFKAFMNAERYRIADRVLRAPENERFLNSVMSPAMVLSAFAAELYFKCILTLESGQAIDTDHNLHNLFRKMSLRSRKRLNALWVEDMATPMKQRVWRALRAATGEDPPTDLVWALQHGADAFTQMRYLHENDGKGTIFLLGDMPDMLRVVVLDLRPEWTPLSHGAPRPIDGID